MLQTIAALFLNTSSCQPRWPCQCLAIPELTKRAHFLAAPVRMRMSVRGHPGRPAPLESLQEGGLGRLGSHPPHALTWDTYNRRSEVCSIWRKATLFTKWSICWLHCVLARKSTQAVCALQRSWPCGLPECIKYHAAAPNLRPSLLAAPTRYSCPMHSPSTRLYTCTAASCPSFAL